MSIEKNIEEIINYELEKPSCSIDLQSGLMGKALFCIWYYNITNDIKYKKWSYDALDLVYKSINSTNVLRFKDGLLGIASALTLSIHKGYLKGDIDNVCQDVDNLLYKAVSVHIDKISSSSYANEYEDFFLDYMLYITFRLKVSLNNKDERELYIRFLSLIFNKVYQSHNLSFYEEPIPASCNYKLAKFYFLLSNMFELNIEVQRIAHILDEMKFRILYKIPYIEHNRLILLITLKSLSAKNLLDTEWNCYISQMEKQVNLDSIFAKLIEDCNLYGEGGLVWLYAFVTYFNSQQELIEYSKESLIQKLELSISRMDYNFIVNTTSTKHCLDGNLGVVWAYYNLKFGK